MIQLPPGCKVSYEIRFTVRDLTDEIGEWFEMIGGKAYHIEVPGRRNFVKIPYVQYGKAKPSYKMQDSTGHFLVRFHGDDASTASMFLLKFMNEIVNHNMKEYDQFH